MEAAPNGPDGQDGRDKITLHIALSKMSTVSMTSIDSELAANAALVLSDPPTAADWQALADKVNELIAALRR